MEMVNEPPLVMGAPFLVQVKVSGGPPSVSPARAKLGGVALNDMTLTTGLVIAPRAGVKYNMIQEEWEDCILIISFNTNKFQADAAV